MQITSQSVSGTSTIRLSGRFDFTAHRDFRAAADASLNDDSINTICIDLQQVDYLDSSALGMLLLLNERAKNKNKAITLKNCQGVVRQVLEVAHLDRVFTIQ